MIQFNEGPQEWGQPLAGQCSEVQPAAKLRGILFRHRLSPEPSWPVLMMGPTGSGKTYQLRQTAEEAGLALSSVNLARHGGSVAALEQALARACPPAKAVIHFFGPPPGMNYGPLLAFIAEPGTIEVMREGVRKVLDLNSMQLVVEAVQDQDTHLLSALNCCLGQKLALVRTNLMSEREIAQILVSPHSPVLRLQARLKQAGFDVSFDPDFYEGLAAMDSVRELGLHAIEQALFDLEQNIYGQLYEPA